MWPCTLWLAGVWLPMTASIRPGEIPALTVTSEWSQMPRGETAGLTHGLLDWDGYFIDNIKQVLSVMIELIYSDERVTWYLVIRNWVTYMKAALKLWAAEKSNCEQRGSQTVSSGVVKLWAAREVKLWWHFFVWWYHCHRIPWGYHWYRISWNLSW